MIEELKEMVCRSAASPTRAMSGALLQLSPVSAPPRPEVAPDASGTAAAKASTTRAADHVQVSVLMQNPGCALLFQAFCTAHPQRVLCRTWSVHSSGSDPDVALPTKSPAAVEPSAPAAASFAEQIAKDMMGAEVLARQRKVKAVAKQAAKKGCIKKVAKQAATSSSGAFATKKRAQKRAHCASPELPLAARRPKGSVGKQSWTLRCPGQVGRITVLMRHSAFYVKPTVDRLRAGLKADRAGGLYLAWAGDPAGAFELAKQAAGWP